MPTSPTRVRSARRAIRAASLVAALAAVACSPDAALVPRVPTVAGADFDVVPLVPGAGDVSAPAGLDFATYDGSREVVHPDVVEFANGWHGHRLWTALTPYPNSAWQVENPSLFTSETGDGWAAPAGVTNPLVRPGAPGYLSDPDLVYDAGRDQLRMYYRQVLMRGEKHLADNVYAITSGDGVRWSAPSLVTSDRNRYVVSPTVVRHSATDWRLWAVDAGTDGCRTKESHVVLRRSKDGARWSASSVAQLSQPGYIPWHIDVEWMAERGQYWALVAAFPKGAGCTATSLFLATSTDGVQWTTYPSPVLARGAVPQFATNVYRSSLLFGADGSVTVWMSGARTAAPAARKTKAKLKWSAAVARTTPAALLARVTQAAPARSIQSIADRLGDLEARNEIP